MIPSLRTLAVQAFLTSPSAEEWKKAYFKQKVPLPQCETTHQIICQEITTNIVHLVKYLKYFSDTTMNQTHPVRFLQAKNPELSSLKVALLLCSAFPNLKKLDLSNTLIKFSQLKVSSVEHLIFSLCDLIPKEDFMMIEKKFPHLKILKISHGKRLVSLSGLGSQIEELDLASCLKLPKEAFLLINQQFPHLKKLRLNSCLINSLKGLGPLIEELTLENCSNLPAQEFLTLKDRLPLLKKLHLIGMNLTSLEGLGSQMEELTITPSLYSSLALDLRDEGIEDERDEDLELEPRNEEPNDNLALQQIQGIFQGLLGAQADAPAPGNAMPQPPLQIEPLQLIGNAQGNNPYADFVFEDNEDIAFEANLLNDFPLLIAAAQPGNAQGNNNPPQGHQAGIPALRFPFFQRAEADDPVPPMPGNAQENNNLLNLLPRLFQQRFYAHLFLTIKQTCPHLKKLNVSSTSIASLEGLGPEIEELNLNDCRQLPKEAFLTIKDQLPLLKRLYITNTSIESLKGLRPEIEELNLNRCKKLPKEVFVKLKDRFPQLKKLNVGFTSIASLKGLGPKIEELTLEYCRSIPKEAFSTLKETCPHLKMLNISCTSIVDLEGLADLSKLEVLNIRKCKISKEHLAIFKERRPLVKIIIR